MQTAAEYELSFQLSVGAIDVGTGLIRGATVAKAGVNAIGKFVCLDKAGELTTDPEAVVMRLPVYTDAKTLETLMAAAKNAGGVLKVRSDHSDLLEDRAGFADSFTLVEDRVTADLHLAKSYKDRDIVLETATTTPKLIGLSIDMIPSFDIVDGKALMRIEQLLAVDLVDGGAITPEGLFFSQTVDKKASINNPNKKLMADAPKSEDKTKEPTLADCMSAISSLAATVAKMAPAPAAPAAVQQAAAPADTSAMATALTAISTKMDAFQSELVQLKKEKAALGVTDTTVTATNDDAGKLSAQKKSEADAAAAAAKPKSFISQVDAKVAASNGKLRRSDAAKVVMSEDPKAYREHLAGKGIIQSMTA